MRYLSGAELVGPDSNLMLYEFPRNEIKSFPKLKKVSPGDYVWNPT